MDLGEIYSISTTSYQINQYKANIKDLALIKANWSDGSFFVMSSLCSLPKVLKQCLENQVISIKVKNALFDL